MTGSREMFEQMREAELNEHNSLSHQLFDLQPTKSNIESAANRMIISVKEGQFNPYELLARMEAVKSYCEQVRSGIEEFVRDELEKYGKSGLKILDAKFDLAEVGVKYDYSNDPKWSALKAQKDSIDALMKEAEKFLKVLSKPLNETDMDTGEITERIPPSKSSKSSFKITLGK